MSLTKKLAIFNDVIPSGRVAADYFGRSADIDGNTIVVGAYAQSYNAGGAISLTSAGAAYVFTRIGNAWGLQAKLVASGDNGRIASDFFGYSVSIYSNTIVVGAYQQDYDASGASSVTNAGAAYIFTRNGITWAQQGKIVASGTNGRIATDQFGQYVSVYNDTVIVGAPLQDYDAAGANSATSTGAAYIFTRSGTTWAQQQKLVGMGVNGRIASDFFGCAVSIYSETAIIGANYQDYDDAGANSVGNAGAAYIFTRSAVGFAWSQKSKLVGTGTNARGATDNAGSAVSVFSDTAIVGSRYHSFDAAGGDSITSAGAAFIFTKNGGVWIQQAKLVGVGTNGRVLSDYFGYSVAIYSETVVVGAYLQDYDAAGGNSTTSTGAAYIFTRSGTTWDLQQKIVGTGVNGRIINDNFGTAVSIYNNTLAASAWQQDYDPSGANSISCGGAIYIFTRNGTTWDQQAKVVGTGTNGRVVNDYLGQGSISLYEDTLAAGTHLQAYDAAGANSVTSAGAIYIFTRSGTAWDQQAKLVGTGTNGRVESDCFGKFMSVYQDTVVVGAYFQDYDETGANSVNMAGAVYIFTRSGTAWNQQAKIVGTGTNGRKSGDQFGVAINLYSNTVLVGAYIQDFDESGANSVDSAGAAYVFTRSGTSWSQTAKLISSGTNGRITSDLFGGAVAIYSSNIIVGAYQQDYDAAGATSVDASGAAFMFDLQPGWAPQQKVVGTVAAMAKNGRNTSDQFGCSVSLYGNTVIVGAHQQAYDAAGANSASNAGAAYIFTRTGGFWEQQTKLVGTGINGRNATDYFGNSVGLYSETAIVGAYWQDYDAAGANSLSTAGAVYIFTRNGTAWDLQQKIVGTGTNGRKSGDQFGCAVGIYSETVVVSADGQTYDAAGANSATSAGAAYVFTRSGAVWDLQQKITATGTNGRLSGDYFGHAVSIYNNTAVVSTHLQDYDAAGANSSTDAGAAYIFTRNGTVWAQQQKIVGTGTNGRITSDYFGGSVSIYSETVVVGAFGQDYDSAGANSLTDTGAAYIFTRSGTTWDQQQKIVGTGTNGRITSDYFGSSVSIYDNTIIIGSPYQDYDTSGGLSVDRAGASYIFTRNGTTWDLQQKVAGGGTNARSVQVYFGNAVSINGESVICGVYLDGYDAFGANLITNAGAAYIFTRSETTWYQEQKIHGPIYNERVANDYFGTSVVIESDTVVVGSYNPWDSYGMNSIAVAGASYVFTRSGTAWSYVKKVVGFGANGRIASDQFGAFVDIYGETIIVGANLQDYDAAGANSATSTGAAYVFTKSGTTWISQQKLISTGTNGRITGDQLGVAVSIYSETVVLGAWYQDYDILGSDSRGDAGAAFIFTRSSNTWAQQQKLVGMGGNVEAYGTFVDRTASDQFGQFVAMHGNTIVVATISQDYDDYGANSLTSAGAAYIFTRSGTTWAQQQKIVGMGTNGRIAGDLFGSAVGIYSDTIVVGAYYQSYDNIGSNSMQNAGAAYIFTRSGTTWAQQQKIVGMGNNGRAANDYFGRSVAIYSESIIVGAYYQDYDEAGANSVGNAGAAYIFTRSGASWSQQQKLVAYDVKGRLTSDSFGYSTGIYNDTIVIGAYQQNYDAAGSNSVTCAGAAYVFTRSGAAWSQQAKLAGVGTNGRIVSDKFGCSVGIYSETIVVGAYLQDYDASGANSLADAGAAFIFTRSGTTWAQQQKIVGTGTNGRLSGDYFGNSVSIYSETIIVGAYYQPFNASGASTLGLSGAAYIFTRNGTTWDQQQKIVGTGTNGRGAQDNFGWSVSIYSETVVVGAYLQDYDAFGANSSQDAGAVYIFTRSGATWDQQQKIVGTGTNARMITDSFGYSVSIYSETVIIGAWRQDYDAAGANSLSNAGAAYIFTRNGTAWDQQQKIAGTGTNGRIAVDLFGSSVSIYGDTVIIGAYQQAYDSVGANSANNAGASYIFTRSGTAWNQQGKIVGTGTNGRLSQDYFGYFVSIYGDTITAGAYTQDYDADGANSLDTAGAAFIITRSGTAWAQQAKLVGPATNGRNGGGDFFGYAVSIHSDTAIVGAYQHCYDAAGANSISYAGAAYIFTRNGTTWDQQGKIAGTGTNGRIATDQFGQYVSVYNDTVIAGAIYQDYDAAGANSATSSGAVYIFTRNGTAWAQQQKIVGTGTNGRITSDFFGNSVSIYSETVIVGAYLQDYDAAGGVSTTGAGAAYIFTRNGTTWDQQQKIVGVGLNARMGSDQFGYSVCVDGEGVVVGANQQDYDQDGYNNAGDAGAAYISTRVGTTWAQQQKITGGPTRQRISNIPDSVSIYGNTIVVGVSIHPYDQWGAASASNAGAAYVFVKNKNNWILQQKLIPTGTNARASADYFGKSVGIYSETIIVGAYAQDYYFDGTNQITDAGATYIFTRASGLWSQQQKLTALGNNERNNTDNFGYSVAVDTDTVVIGVWYHDYDVSGGSYAVNAGAAYIFTRSGAAWAQQQKIVGTGTNGRVAGDNFGRSVSIYGNTVLVGANLQTYDSNGANSLTQTGAVYVFTRSGTTWYQEQKLTSPQRVTSDNLGYSVSIFSDTAIAGAYYCSRDESEANYLAFAGAAFIFTRSGAVWAQQQKIAASNTFGVNERVSNDYFGYSVAVDTDTVVVGVTGQAYNAAGNVSVNQAGAVYIFTRSGAAWSEQAKLVGTGTNGRKSSDMLGNKVSIYGNTIVVGAYLQDYDASGANSLTSAGAAYIFTRDGTAWAQQAKLVGTGTNGRLANDNFGLSVSIYSDTVIVGAWYQDYDATGANSADNAGAAYIFTRNGTTWDQQQKIVATGTNGRLANNYFGAAVSIYSETVVVGAYYDSYDATGASWKNNAGAAYIFTRSSTTWDQQQKIVGTGTNGRSVGDYFGFSVSIYSETIAVGAYNQDYDASGANSADNAGATYIFTRSGTTWDQQQKIVGTGTNGRIAVDNFGYFVSIYSETIVVGAMQQPYDTAGANSLATAGASYIFTRSGTTWAQQQKIVGTGSNGRVANDYFGRSISVYGDTVVVGAFYQDYDAVGANSLGDAGAAFIITRSGTTWAQQAKLVGQESNSRKQSDQFGWSVAIYSETAVVSANQHAYDNIGSNSVAYAGAAYIYTRTGTTWDIQQKIVGTGTNGRVLSDYFGWAVGIYSETIAVSAYYQDYDAAGANSATNAGAAYVFTRSGTTWAQQQKIVGMGTNGRIASDNFGYSIYIYSETIAVGAWVQDYDAVGAVSSLDAGATYIFTRDGTTWGQQGKVVGTGNNGRKGSDGFGCAVGVYGDTVVNGAYQHSFDALGANSVSNAGAVFISTRSGTAWSQQAKLTATDNNQRNQLDNFGYSVSIFGETVVIGAYNQGYDTSGANYATSAGAAYIFTRNGTTWGFQQKIIGTGTNGRLANDQFGMSVSIYSETVIAGAYYQDYDAAGANSVGNSGAAFIFTRSGTTWDLQQKILGSGTNGRVLNDYFGYSVSIYSETAIVGAYQQDYDGAGANSVDSAGAAYIFTRSGATWSQQQKVVGTSNFGIRGRTANDAFGYSVAAYNNTIIVGVTGQSYDASGNDSVTSAGAAYVFTRSGTTWAQQQKLVGTGINGRLANDVFGNAVGIYSDTVVIGAWRQDYDASGANSATDAGASYIFTRNGTTWDQQQKIVGTGTNGRITQDYFGYSVSIYSETVVVGAYGQRFDASGANSAVSAGAAYIFTRSGTTWAQQQKIVGTGTNGRLMSDCFGASVSIYSETVIVGAYAQDYDSSGANSATDAGASYVFTRSGTTWAQQQKIVGTGTNGRVSGDVFGNAVSIYGETVIVGAIYQDYDAAGANSVASAGAVYIFTRNGTIWDQQQKIVGTGTNGRVLSDYFGYFVGIYSETIAIGVYYQDYDASGASSLTNAGAAYIFTRNGTTWDQQQKIVGTGTNGRNASDYFGYVVNIYSEIVVVGAYAQSYDDIGGNSVLFAGAAYICTRNGTTWAQQQKLVAPESNARNATDDFGWSVSIYSETAIVGAYLQDYDALGHYYVDAAGAAYIFTRNGTTWGYTQKIVGTGVNGRGVNDYLGKTVAIYSNTTAVGCANAFDGNAVNYFPSAGAVYVSYPARPQVAGITPDENQILNLGEN